MNKYLVVSPYPPPFWGGHLVYLSTLIENCSESFDILTNALPQGQHEIISQKDRPIRKQWIRSMFKQPTLLKQIITYPYILLWIVFKRITHKYEAILVNWAPAPNSLVNLLGKIIGIPTIGFLHGEEITVTLRSKGVKGMMKRVLMKYGYKRADGFIASCHFIREKAVELGVDPSIIDVVPVCFNPRNLSTSATNRKTGYTIISIGTVVERKGFHLLIDAVYALREELPQIKVNIIGEGPFMPVIKERIQKYGMKNHVVLHGNLFEEKLAKLFDESDLFVLANTMLDDGNTEGASLVVCDASGHGLPVIAGSGGGLATNITDGVTGFIVDSRDTAQLASKIKQILTCPDLANKMGKAGIEKVRRDHNPKKAGVLFGESLKRLIDKRPPSCDQIMINNLLNNRESDTTGQAVFIERTFV